MYRKRSGPVAEFKDPDWRDKVNSGIDNHYAGVNFIPQSEIYERGY